MKKILKLQIIVIILISPSYIFPQNLYNIKKCPVLFSYSDDSKKMKSAIPNIKEIMDLLEYEIPAINFQTTISNDNYDALLIISIDFYSGYKDKYYEEYYGGVNLKIWRYFEINQFSKNMISDIVWNDIIYFLYHDTEKDKIHKDLKDLLSRLIISFAKKYYEDN